MFNYWLRFDEKFLNALPHRKNDNWSKERKTHAKWSVTRCDIGRKLLCILKTSEKNHKIWNVSKIRSHSLDNSCPCSRIVFRLYLAFLSIAKKESYTNRLNAMLVIFYILFISFPSSPSSLALWQSHYLIRSNTTNGGYIFGFNWINTQFKKWCLNYKKKLPEVKLDLKLDDSWLDVALFGQQLTGISWYMI